MGFLSSLFKNKKTGTNVVTVKKVNRVQSDQEKFKKDYNKYYSLIGKGPAYYKYSEREYDMPSYDDAYVTKEKYKLRELLLLVWWGKPKNGRNKNVAIPKYFF